MVLKTDIAVPTYALRALDVLERAGFEAWFVGGCVRDSILGRAVSDYDIACSAPWEQAEQALGEAGLEVRRSGVKHGTLTAVIEGEALEVTTFRSDGKYLDGRHPDTVEFVKSIEEDLARRDFTVNALAYHPARGLLDCWDGLGDLEAGTIRAVGDAAMRFGEDGLRILRGCRFASQLGFAIEEGTLQAMTARKSMLARVSAERITHELDMLLLGDFAYQALMGTVDVLCAVLPEITACKGFDQRTPYHIYDVWEHTAWVVQRSPATRLARWAALFHDIGKPSAFFMDGERAHFYGHAELSAALARGAMERLSMAPSFARRILALVRAHDDQIPATMRGVRRALSRFDGDVELFRALVGIKKADALAQSRLGEDRLNLACDLELLLDEVLETDSAFTVSQLAIDGHDVIGAGIPGGPLVGTALDGALEAVIDELVPNERVALIQFVKDRYTR